MSSVDDSALLGQGPSVPLISPLPKELAKEAQTQLLAGRIMLGRALNAALQLIRGIRPSHR